MCQKNDKTTKYENYTFSIQAFKSNLQTKIYFNNCVQITFETLI
jgi:hypothetical protein